MATATVTIRLTRNGPRQLRHSPRVVADLQRRGDAIAAAAGEGHRVETTLGKERPRVAVITDSFGAMWAEARRRTLTAAVDAGRRS